MKNIVSKFYLVVAFLFSTAIIFAQPGDNTDLNDMEGADNQLPISDNLWILLVLGLVFIFRKHVPSPGLADGEY